PASTRPLPGHYRACTPPLPPNATVPPSLNAATPRQPKRRKAHVIEHRHPRPETSTSGPEAPHPSKPAHGALTWVLVVAASIAGAALAVVAFGGVAGYTRTTRLDRKAEQYERQAHLDGQANTPGQGGAAVSQGETADEFARRAEAERLEWQAHL